MLENRILIIDDEPLIRESLSETISRTGFEVHLADNGIDALSHFKRFEIPLVIVDLKMPDMDGIEVLKRIKKISPETKVVVITAHGSVEIAVEAMREGACDFLMKPFSATKIQEVVNKAFNKRSEERVYNKICTDNGNGGVITRNSQMVEILTTAEKVAKIDATVLIQGESGTGKELLARVLHDKSARARGPFVAINCAALPESLLETELFGHEKGAFTGAIYKRIGKFESANRGTILLDEISEISPAIQAKLLRTLQEREIDRVGGSNTIKLDVRVLSTTNKDLREEIQKGKFRQDLFFRLNVVSFILPPLRDRTDDIPLLAMHFLKRYSKEYSNPVEALSNETIDLLKNYTWPGNIRELENCIQRAIIICQDKVLRPKHLILDGELTAKKCSFSAGISFYDMERQFILDTLKQVDGNRTRAAKILGLSVRTIRNKLREYRINR